MNYYPTSKNNDETPEATISDVIDAIIEQDRLIDNVLGDMEAYITIANDKVAANGLVADSIDRTKFMATNHSHHLEIDERLQFI